MVKTDCVNIVQLQRDVLIKVSMELKQRLTEQSEVYLYALYDFGLNKAVQSSPVVRGQKSETLRLNWKYWKITVNNSVAKVTPRGYHLVKYQL